MSCCPKCGRNSLEFSDKRKMAWCLYVEDCGFETSVENYDNYIEKYASQIELGRRPVPSK